MKDYESPLPKLPHTLPKNISQLLGKVLKESPGTHPESYRFKWMNEDGRHFLSLFNMGSISLGLCTLKSPGKLVRLPEAQATPWTTASPAVPSKVNLTLGF